MDRGERRAVAQQVLLDIPPEGGEYHQGDDIGKFRLKVAKAEATLQRDEADRCEAQAKLNEDMQRLPSQADVAQTFMGPLVRVYGLETWDPTTFEVGDTVEITGLMSESGRTQNGKRGTVQSDLLSSAQGGKRHGVCVEGSANPVHLKPSNLRKLGAERDLQYAPLPDRLHLGSLGCMECMLLVMWIWGPETLPRCCQASCFRW